MAKDVKKSGSKKNKRYQLPPESDKHAAYTRVDEEADFAYTIVTTNGKPKSLIWSLAALIFGVLSVVLGFFNKYIIIGLITSIFGATLGTVFVIADSFNLF